MLILTRKAGQSIVIGDDIEVTLLAVDASKVRLGIQAPQGVPIHRREIYIAIHETGDDEVGPEPRDRMQAPPRQAS